MNVYQLSDWTSYRWSLGFKDDESFLAAYEFSDWFKDNFNRFELELHELSIEEAEKIVLEIKSLIKVPTLTFQELEIIFALNKPLVDPLFPFSKPGFAIHKNGGEWNLFEIKSGFLVSRLTNRGTGKLPVSTKLACITDTNFEGQGLTTELGRLYIEEMIPEGGIFEISAFHPASASLAKKGGFTLNPETNTWILKVSK